MIRRLLAGCVVVVSLLRGRPAWRGTRRRGTGVRLVGSRHTVVRPTIGRALLETVRRALAVGSVVRPVVRLAPEGGVAAASMVTEDAAGTHLVRLDTSGARTTAKVQSRAR